MPKAKADTLHDLIKSMTKAEKRHFKMFVNRSQSSQGKLFVKLFDVLDKAKDFNPSHIFEKIPDLKKRQLSNLKANLYNQILVTLRLVHRNQNIDIELREKLDYAKILYNKSLYRQCLEILSKAKQKAIEHKYFTLTAEMLEFEKFVESQHITRSIDGRAEALSNESIEVNDRVRRIQQFSNLAIQLYGLYLKVGHVRNIDDSEFLEEFMHSKLPDYNIKELSFFEKLYLFQAMVWYHYMRQEFLKYYKYCQMWIDLFREEPKMIDVYTPLYIKGMHNLMNACYLTMSGKRFRAAQEEYNNFLESKRSELSSNELSLMIMFENVHQFNRHFMEGTFNEGFELAENLDKIINANTYKWDEHRIMVFYYKIASLYFGAGDNSKAIDYLNKIINEFTPNFRGDIHSFARILSLIAHFELGNELLLSYHIKSVYRFLMKMENMQSVQREILKFLRKVPSMHKSQLKKEFIALKNQLKKIEKDPYEKRAYLYLDIISWLESKIKNVPVQEVIRAKYLKRNKVRENLIS